MDWQAVSLFHVTLVTSAPWCLAAWFFLVVGFVFVVFCFVSPGELWMTSFSSSSRDMTATVLSNAALEKKIASPSQCLGLTKNK